MEYDAQMARRVWQRVRGEGNGSGEIQSFLAETLRWAAIYRRLARQEKGPRGVRIGRLERESRELTAAVRGILIGAGENPPRQSQRDPAPAGLAEGLRSTVTRYGQCRALAEDPMFGPVWAGMGEILRGQCVLLAALLGESA